MKTKRPLGFILIILTLVACEPAATFEEPQPFGANSIKSFPRKITGTYQSLQNESLLILTKDKLIRVTDVDFTEHKNQLDSTSVLRGDTLVNLKSGEKIKVKIEGDSVIQHHHLKDTLFYISKNGILTKSKGYYFLNIKYDKSKWIVRSLAYQNGRLVLKDIDSKEDLEKLKAITKSTNDTLAVFNPTRKEFKRFIKQEGFQKEEQFIRIK